MDRKSDQDAGQMRIAAVVIAVAMVGWLAMQYIGSQYGLAAKWAYLVDLGAIGAFVWSLLVTWRIWRRRNA